MSPGQGPELFNHGCSLPSQQEHASSEKHPFVDCEVNDPPDSTVHESDISGFVLSTEARLCDSVVDGDKVDEASDNLEPDCKAPVEIHFNPEDFNFDIGKLQIIQFRKHPVRKRALKTILLNSIEQREKSFIKNQFMAVNVTELHAKITRLRTSLSC